ncbi:threonine/serine ThrE exporter family protein [Wenjunlia tyrosinilytica]|uniref:Membrane protein n=1 Tax=Wenjunlia tyrosinilytica TaxID=1544741 RepID=A0A918DXM4_9ACTN|nr:threonine/serine exporter family protein [Wenjunlia tyrosinilytica]GGO89452.1 membrane protein [Wenjunlia tyrosinilytica]
MAHRNGSGEGANTASGTSALEDHKPVPDEAHSAFTPPLGVPLPPPPPVEGSAFTLPGGSTTGTNPLPPQPPAQRSAAFTPPGGIPVVRATGGPWQDRMRTLLRTRTHERSTPEQSAPQEISVPRVLDLILRLGELLLAGGEGAEDVEAAMYAVAHAYALDRSEPNVTFTLLSISYQASLVDDPVTASRVVRRRGTDYTRLAAVYRLVDDIAHGELKVEEAYRRLAGIRRNRHPYPGWLLSAAGGVLAGAASVLVGGGPVVFLAAMVAAVLGDRLAWLLAGRGLPEFYQFVIAAMPAAAMGVILELTRPDIEASAVITGGLFALLPGRPLVAAVQDGLTGFYITASARLLEVMYLVVGIVCGVLLVLYVGLRFDAELDPEQAFRTVERPPVQLIAAMVLTLAFAVMLQSERQTLLIVTLNGGIAWTVFAVLHDQADVSPVLATLVAAGLVGLFGQLLSRYRFASVLPYVTAAIGPLLPGSAIYRGLLSFAQGHAVTGWSELSKAAALALAIAVGVNLGGEASRLFLRVPGFEDPARRRAAKRTRGF